jgi:cytochrome c oxidase cbb3-type subunit 3
MTAPSEDDKTDHEAGSTGHEWDGIRELDNPLPRWWLWIFYATIIFSIGYWVLWPAWPLVSDYTHGVLHRSDRADVERQLDALRVQRGAQMARLGSASLQQIESDESLRAYAVTVGRSVYGDNCATCHGVGGTGSPGYPNLRDDVWLWGGSLDDIYRTITVGVRSGHQQARMSQMPSFGRDQMLTPQQVDDATAFVLALSRRPSDPAAVARGRTIFAEQCSSCHGAGGQGNQQLGAPNLTDADWLYGSSRQAIRDQIYYGRGGVMPTWGQRFDEATRRALAVYVHSEAGG